MVGRVRIIIDVDLGDPDLRTTFSVAPPIPLHDVARILRVYVEGIETGQIDKLTLPRGNDRGPTSRA